VPVTASRQRLALERCRIPPQCPCGDLVRWKPNSVVVDTPSHTTRYNNTSQCFSAQVQGSKKTPKQGSRWHTLPHATPTLRSVSQLTQGGLKQDGFLVQAGSQHTRVPNHARELPHRNVCVAWFGSAAVPERGAVRPHVRVSDQCYCWPEGVEQPSHKTPKGALQTTLLKKDPSRSPSLKKDPNEPRNSTTKSLAIAPQ
jgi:hypothetical protein